MTHDPRKGFLKALKANPYDTTTRMIYADWLDDQCMDAEAAEQRRMATPEWCEARRWLWEYAQEANPYDTRKYVGGDEVFEPIPGGDDLAFKNLIEGLRTGEMYFHGTDLHGLHELDDADELKQHAEAYLGNRRIDWNEFTFSCSC